MPFAAPKIRSTGLLSFLILGLTAAFIIFFVLLDHLGIMGKTGRIYTIILMSLVGVVSSIKELMGRKKSG